jgi:hypothetical protein
MHVLRGLRRNSPGQHLPQLRRRIYAKAHPAGLDAGETSRLHGPGVGCELRGSQRNAAVTASLDKADILPHN